MLFKKKTKKPNKEYPICNPESKVKDYGKILFCLVEDINTDLPKELVEVKPNNLNINIDVNNGNNVNINDKKKDEEAKGYKTCRDKCLGFFIY